MGISIIKLDEDLYLEWSSISDAPASYVMTLQEFREYYVQKYGEHSLPELENRLERVESKGTSCHWLSLEEQISDNRAGDNEICLSIEEIKFIVHESRSK